MSTEFKIPDVVMASLRLDSLFAECGFASDHPALQDWVAVKFALKSAVTGEQQLKAEILPSFSEGMEFLLRKDFDNAVLWFNKVAAKLSAV